MSSSSPRVDDDDDGKGKADLKDTDEQEVRKRVQGNKTPEILDSEEDTTPPRHVAPLSPKKGDDTTKDDEGIEIIVIDSMTHLINELFTRKEKSDGTFLPSPNSPVKTRFPIYHPVNEQKPGKQRYSANAYHQHTTSSPSSPQPSTPSLKQTTSSPSYTTPQIQTPHRTLSQTNAITKPPPSKPSQSALSSHPPRRSPR